MTPEQTRNHIVHKLRMGDLDATTASQMISAQSANPDLSYAELLHQVERGPIRHIVYHSAPRSARESISRNGLVASLPRESSKWGEQHGVRGQVKGVYVSLRPDTDGAWANEPEWDVWAVDTTGLKWEHDPINKFCWVITEDIPAERIANLSKYLFPQKTDQEKKALIA